MRATYVLGLHDKDGDTFDTRIFIFLGRGHEPFVAIPLKSVDDLDELIKTLEECSKEITELTNGERK